MEKGIPSVKEESKTFEPCNYVISFGDNNIPHTCPVCFGKGIVANGFYRFPGSEWSSTSTTPETCRSCGGSGVVWR